MQPVAVLPQIHAQPLRRRQESKASNEQTNTTKRKERGNEPMKTLTTLFALFSATILAQAAVTLEWDASPNHNQIHSYIVVYGPEPGYYTNATWFPAIPTNFDHTPTGTVTNMPPGTNYVSVTAELNGVTSPLAKEIVVVVPEPPVNLRVVAGQVVNIRIEVVGEVENQ